MDSVRASLKEKCLSVILENFERFFEAFKVSHGTVLGKLFEFLERAFSETLFRKLLVSDELEEKYLEFLINPHVHRLDLQGINEDLLPGLLKQLNSIENNIVFLKTGFFNVELDPYKQLICCVSNVEILELSNFVFPEVLEEIGKTCHVLRVLKFFHCEVDDVALMNIFMNAKGEYETKTSLEQLDLASTLVTSDGVSFALSHAPSLKRLDYSDTPEVLYRKHKGDLENNCFENLKYSLTSLSFPSWQKDILDTLKICTAVCPDVTSLSINCLESDEQLVLCSKFQHLKDLKICVGPGTNPFSFDGITQFLRSRGRSLFSIYLENGCVSAKAIVEHCPKLCSLKLNAAKFEPLNQEHKCLLSKLKLVNLKTLSLMNSNFSVTETVDSLKLILSNAKNVNCINFSYSEGLTENFVHSISQLGLLQVHELNVNSSDITVPPLVDLVLRGNLKKLFVANCPNVIGAEYINLLSCRDDNDVLIVTTPYGRSLSTYGSDGESSDSDADVDYDYEDYDDDFVAYASENDYDFSDIEDYDPLYEHEYSGYYDGYDYDQI